MTLRTDQELENALGALLSNSGQSRDVYNHAYDSDKVIKKWKNYSETEMGCSANNWLEWQIWCHLKGTEFESRFAKCHEISQSGLYLVMQKLDVCGIDDQKEVDAIDWPSFLNDIIAFNFGRTENGDIQCLDYSSVRQGHYLNLTRKSSLLDYDPLADLK